MNFLFSISTMTKLIAAAALAASLVAGYYGWRTHQRNIGWSMALKAVERQNAEAAAVAKKVQGKVDDCYSRSGTVWNMVTATCEEEEK